MKRENLELAITTIDKIESLEQDLQKLEILEAIGGELEVVINYDEEEFRSAFLKDYDRFSTQIKINKNEIIKAVKAMIKEQEDILETL
jgi:hypothetical protein